MYNLEEVRIPIQRLTNGVASALRVEVAVFDNEATLFYGTQTYVKKKGRAVHAPSIQEVLRLGNVLVNTPGEMPSCVGCRFKDNCPSTVEILSCIKVEGNVLGVVGLTSFSKEGHSRISGNTEVYLNAITELATLIGDVAFFHSADRPQVSASHYVAAILETAQDPVLVANANGVITQYNKLAVKTLSFCSLAAASLWRILPEEIVTKSLSGARLFKEDALLGEIKCRVNTRPVYLDKKLAAVVVRLTEINYDTRMESEFVKRIIGVGDEAKTVHFLIKKLADSPTPVLITGETGTGKELAARAIHEQSRRRKFPFVAINCSSIPESLFESELFGYEEGSFTGAKKGGKLGKFELAQGGTLFLDEVGDMPLSAQPKLLRVLQDFKVERIGSTESVALDIRIVAATNCDLQSMMREGKFREDLFYRLGVINIELPPLRKRQDDVLPIALDYLLRLKDRLDTPVTGFSQPVLDLFSSYGWPGNIRELQNVVEYAANLCESEMVALRDLPPRMLQAPDRAAADPHATHAAEDRIPALLDQYGCTLEGKKQIARILGISLRTLYRKLEKLDLA